MKVKRFIIFLLGCVLLILTGQALIDLAFRNPREMMTIALINLGMIWAVHTVVRG